ncbi:MAG: hypothetical protein HQ567_15980, partial [Candidatus Nealsonbacteria bacterium]|nr:hypothetical protein [Candidatus Nealsonbacteria bacterium]
MSSPEGKSLNGSANGRLEAELAQARAEAEAAELKAKVLALEAKLQHQGPAEAETLQDDLPVKKLPPAQQSAEAAVATSTAAQPPLAQPRVKDTATAAAVVASQPPSNDGNDDEEEDKKKRLAAVGLVGLLGASQSWVWSMIVHLAAMIVLGLIYLEPPGADDLIPLVASMTEEEMDELEELPEEELEFEEIKGLAFDIEDPGMADFGQPELAEEMSEMDFEHVSSTITEVGALFGESGKGWATAGTGSGGAEFYGVKTRGNKFVFVVDNSLSMSKGRFESACYELYYSVTKMAPDQEFYVLFF